MIDLAHARPRPAAAEDPDDAVHDPRLLCVHITSQCGRFTNGLFSCWLTGHLRITDMEAVIPE